MATMINGNPAVEHEGWSICYMPNPPNPPKYNPWCVFHDACSPQGYCITMRTRYGWGLNEIIVSMYCGKCKAHVPDETLGFIELCKWAGVRTGERHEYQG